MQGVQISRQYRQALYKLFDVRGKRHPASKHHQQGLATFLNIYLTRIFSRWLSEHLTPSVAIDPPYKAALVQCLFLWLGTCFSISLLFCRPVYEESQSSLICRLKCSLFRVHNSQYFRYFLTLLDCRSLFQPTKPSAATSLNASIGRPSHQSW